MLLPRVDNRAVGGRAVDLHAFACDGLRRYHLCVFTAHFQAMISVSLAPAQRRSAPQASVGTDAFTPAMIPFTETEFNGIGGSANLRQDCADMRDLREWKTEYARDRCLSRDRCLCRRFRRSNCAYSSLFTLDAKRTQMRGRRENGMCCSPRQFLLRTMHSLIP